MPRESSYRDRAGKLVRVVSYTDDFPDDFDFDLQPSGKSEEDIMLIVLARMILIAELPAAFKRGRAKAKMAATGQRTMFDHFGKK